MDPLAGLSVACNVMQVIQFSVETLAIFRQMKEGALPDPYIQANSRSLLDTTNRLKQTLNTPAIANGIPSDAALLQVCNKLVVVVAALNDQSQKVIPQPGASKVKVFGKTLKYQLRHKSKIDKMAQQLDRLQSRMQLEILGDLRNTLKDVQGDISLRLQNMDQDLQRFYTLVVAGHTRLEELVNRESGHIKDTITKEAQKTREDTTQHAQDIQNLIKGTKEEQINTAAYQRFLESFRFPQFNARRNMISDSHNKTSEWVFESPGNDLDQNTRTHPWYSFPDWLRAGKGIYWISGKAGAGKSTLFKFLLEHPKTREILAERNPKTTIISAFIWSVGTPMQKTLRGVLCTLLYEMFDQRIDLYSFMSTSQSVRFGSKKEHSDWSLKELETLFLSAVNNSAYPFCVFIDGLDEVDRSKPAEITTLMNWLERTATLENIKICASSRPETIFENRLHIYPHLRVQDLTAGDIRRYVSDSLDQLDLKVGVSLNEWHTLIDQIVRKAEGVFLWVHLVVEHIRTDIEFSSGWVTLKQRVDKLPSDLHSMYEMMWKRRNGDSDIYRAETAFYLNSLIAKYSPYEGRLFECMLEWNLNVQEMILQGGIPVSDGFLLEECSRFNVNVAARCGGLVASSGMPLPTQLPQTTNEQEKLLSHMLYFQLTFIHRSATEFLLETDMGLEILGYDVVSALDHNRRTFGASLCSALIQRRSEFINETTFHMSPFTLGLQDHLLYSTALDLLVCACGRIPEWRSSISGPDGAQITHIDGYIAADLATLSFPEQFSDHFSELSPEDQHFMKKKLLLNTCIYYNYSLKRHQLDIMVDYINSLQPQDLTDRITVLPFGSLTMALFAYAERLFRRWPTHEDLEAPQHLLHSLLHKLNDNGINLSVLQTIILFSGEEGSLVSLPPNAWRKVPSLGRSCQSVNGWLVTVVRASIKQAFLEEGGPLHKHVQTFAQPTSQESGTHTPKIMMIMRLMTDKDLKISGVFSKPIYSDDAVEDASELSRVLLRSVRKRSNGRGEEIAFKDYQESSEEIEKFSLRDFYNNLEEPELDTEETIAFLVNEGCLDPQTLENANPLEALVSQDFRYSGIPKSRKTTVNDWSFKPQYKNFSNAYLEATKAEKDVGNSMAIAPAHGGMLFKKAQDQMDRNWESNPFIFL